MHAVMRTSLVVLLALAVGGLPVADDQKWYDLEDNEFQVVAKPLKTLRTLEHFGDGRLISINFGRSSSSFVNNDDGTYLFDVYRMVGPTQVTRILLSPATGNPDAPSPPFQHLPSAVINAREMPKETTDHRADASEVFPSNTTFYKGAPVYVLEAVGKVHLRVTDVKKLMAHRALA